MDTKAKPRILVTGGGGFLGRALLNELHEETSPFFSCPVRVFDIRDEKPLKRANIEYIVGDIRDSNALHRAMENIDIVFHLAALVDWGTHSPKIVNEVNFGGTKNVIAACKDRGVKVLVCTSSVDAIFTGNPILNADETHEYPRSFHNAYCEGKVMAEQVAQAAATPSLKVAIIRPGGIYGEADPYHMSSVIGQAKKGFYIRIGNGRAKSMHVYVGNVAHGHVLAANALWNEKNEVNGEIFFIGDQEPENFFSTLDPMVESSGYRIQPKNLWLPKNLVYVVACLIEFGAFLLRPFVHLNPKITRFAVQYTCTDFTFSFDKAKRMLDYEPKWSRDEAFYRTSEYFRNNGVVKRRYTRL